MDKCVGVEGGGGGVLLIFLYVYVRVPRFLRCDDFIRNVYIELMGLSTIPDFAIFHLL